LTRCLRDWLAQWGCTAVVRQTRPKRSAQLRRSGHKQGTALNCSSAASRLPPHPHPHDNSPISSCQPHSSSPLLSGDLSETRTLEHGCQPPKGKPDESQKGCQCKTRRSDAKSIHIHSSGTKRVSRLLSFSRSTPFPHTVQSGPIRKGSSYPPLPSSPTQCPSPFAAPKQILVLRLGYPDEGDRQILTCRRGPA
jgi:hypothetical protein